MKNARHTLLLALAILSIAQNARSQDKLYQYRIFVLPSFGPDMNHAIALRKLGLKKSNYSVLVKVRLPGDSLFYLIPGTLPTGDSFGFRVKTGNRNQSDTLFLIRRGGQDVTRLAEVCLLIFHSTRPSIARRPDHTFINDVLARYNDQLDKSHMSTMEQVEKRNLNWVLTYR